MNFGRTKRRSGFTLVELLIVIGVIVVLIALLLPSVASVRARARSVEAQSNLAQLGLALNAANRNRSTPVMHTDSDGILWTKQIQPFLEGENEALFVSPADPNAEERGPDEPSFAANNQMHRMGSGDGKKIVILDFEEEGLPSGQDGVFEAAPDSNGDNQWTPEVEGNWQNALDAAGQRQGGNVNVLRHDGSVSSESAQDLMDYHPQNSPEDWKPWRADSQWICPDGQDCSPPDALTTDLTPDVPDAPPEEEEDTEGESPSEEEESEEPYESGPPPDPYEPCDEYPQDPTGAVDKALEWLVAQQQDDGSWHLDGGHGPKPGCGTGMALLALLGSGNTPYSGTYKQEVCDGVKFLISYQTGNGELEGGSLYSHLIAHWALAEAVLLSNAAQENGCNEGCDLTIAQMKAAGDLAVDFTAYANANEGGWAYTPVWGAMGTGRGDTSHLHFAIGAILASEKAGLKKLHPFTGWRMREAVYDHLNGVGWYPLTDPNTGDEYPSQYGYWEGNATGGPRDQPSRRCTACGLISRIMLDEAGIHEFYGSVPVEHPIVDAFFEANEPDTTGDFYYNKPATFLAYARGGDVWTKWNNILTPHLTATQLADGSWYFPDHPDGHNANGGKLYNTTFAIMCMGAGYAGLKIFD